MRGVSNDTAKPIMIRAAITDDEWTALRMLALRDGVTVQALVGDLIRERLEREAT